VCAPCARLYQGKELSATSYQLSQLSASFQLLSAKPDLLTALFVTLAVREDTSRLPALGSGKSQTTAYPGDPFRKDLSAIRKTGLADG